MANPDLAQAINAFERRIRVSPTLRDMLLFDEYIHLRAALIVTADELRELTARCVEMRPAQELPDRRGTAAEPPERV